MDVGVWEMRCLTNEWRVGKIYWPVAPAVLEAWGGMTRRSRPSSRQRFRISLSGAVLLWLMAAAAPAAQEPALRRVAVVVVSLDDATQGQIRYGRTIVAATGSGHGVFEFTPSPIEETAFQSCLDRSLDRAAECARFYIGHNSARAARPPIVVVLLSDADADEESRNGQLAVSCIGVGEAYSDPERQTIRLWPDAARVHGMNALLADRAAMTECIGSALAEGGG